MSLCRTVSETKGDFPTPVHLTPQMKGFSLELDTGARRQKTRMTGLPEGSKIFKIGLAV